jgi:hypothetical protein
MADIKEPRGMDSVQVLISYDNGGTKVTICEDGTKVRETLTDEAPLYPESIDVKITDYCNMGCQYCHEKSTLKGQHGSTSLLMRALKDLPPGIELALGGGAAQYHPDFRGLLHKLNEKGFIANLTINYHHLYEYLPELKKLVKEGLLKGVGVSIPSGITKFGHKDPLVQLKEFCPNVVHHLILGVNTPHDLNILHSAVNHLEQPQYNKTLLLGYKTWGFGETYGELHGKEIEGKIKSWQQQVHTFLRTPGITLSFDNLAIEQLEMRRFFVTKGEWDKFYMGDDFTHSMYIDLVKQEYAPTSRSPNRVKMTETSLLEFFSTRLKENNASS